MEAVAKAAGQLFNRHHFDQHIHQRISYDSSDSESEDESHKPKNSRSHLEDETDTDSNSDDSDSPRKPVTRKKKHSTHHRTIPRKDSHSKSDSHPKKMTEDDLTASAHQILKLSLKDPKVRAVYANIFREVMQNDPSLVPPPNPPVQDHQFHRDPPSHQDAPPPRFYRPPQSPTPELPPQITDQYCYGCNQSGHHIQQCEEINTLINQGIVMRNDFGRLQWPDGSPISKDRRDSWVHGIQKALKMTNMVRTESHHPHSRLNSCTRTSRESWRLVQANPLSQTYSANNPAIFRGTADSRQPSPPISQNIRSNSYQPRVPTQVIPLATSQSRLELRPDSQPYPDYSPLRDFRQKVQKIRSDQRLYEAVQRSHLTTQPGKTSLDTLKKSLGIPHSMSREEVMDISSTRQSDLNPTSRQDHRTPLHRQEHTREDYRESRNFHALAAGKQTNESDTSDCKPEQDTLEADTTTDEEPSAAHPSRHVQDNRDSRSEGRDKKYLFFKSSRHHQDTEPTCATEHTPMVIKPEH